MAKRCWLRFVIGDGIRGEDWQTSLNLCHTDPSSPTHNGYADTAEAIYLRLQAYLHDARTPGSALKLWVTGFGSGRGDRKPAGGPMR